jgi:hypothetical protein
LLSLGEDMLEDGEEVRAVWVAAAILWRGDVGASWAMGLVVLWASPRLICTRQEQRDVLVATKQAARAPFLLRIEARFQLLVYSGQWVSACDCWCGLSWTRRSGGGQGELSQAVGTWQSRQREQQNSKPGDTTTYLSTREWAGGQCGVRPCQSERVDTMERRRAGCRASSVWRWNFAGDVKAPGLGVGVAAAVSRTRALALAVCDCCALECEYCAWRACSWPSMRLKSGGLDGDCAAG